MKKKKLLIGLILMNLIVISILSASYQDCIDASDCPEGTEANCKQDSNGEWYFTCDVIPIDCVPDPSTNLDCTKKCSAGRVYDYALGSLGKPCCCPDATPFSYQGGCYSFPTPTSDNWFTRKSDCKGMEKIGGGTGFWWNGYDYSPNIQAYPTLDSMISAHYNSLEGNPMKYLYCLEGNFFVCTASSPGIYEYVNRGKVIGRCNVQCTQDNDCLDNQMCENSVCLNLCPLGQTKCSDGVCKELCEDCSAGQIKCEDGICKENCNKNPISTIAIILLVLLGAGIIASVFLIKRRK